MEVALFKIEEAAEVAQRLIDELYRREPEHATFEQLGILDGQQIVMDFIQQREWGLALEHLLYMIHESAISFPREPLLELHAIAAQYGCVDYYKEDV